MGNSAPDTPSEGPGLTPCRVYWDRPFTNTKACVLGAGGRSHGAGLGEVGLGDSLSLGEKHWPWTPSLGGEQATGPGVCGRWSL